MARTALWKKTHIRLAALAAAATLVASCSTSTPNGAASPTSTSSGNSSGPTTTHSTGSSSSGSGSSDDPYALDPSKVDTTWDVNLADDAVLIDYDAAKGLIDADPAKGTYTFTTSALEGTHLAKGDVMLVAGVGLGRVTGVQRSGDRTTVTTSEASLADAIDSGTMAWDAKLPFDPQMIAAPDAGGVKPAPASWRHAADPTPRFAGLEMIDAHGGVHPVDSPLTDGKITWTFSDGGNTYKFQLTPTPQQVEVKVQVTRNHLTYTATGTVNAITSTGSANYDHGELGSMQVDQKDLAGKLKLSIAAAGAGSGDIDFTVPGLMFKYIVPVGPVPVTIGMSAQVIGKYVVPASGSSVFTSKFSYRGDAGFSYDGSKVSSKATMGSYQMNPDKADAAGSIGVPVNAQLGLAFPRVSVSIFDQGLIPFIEPGAIIGTNLKWGPVCKSAYVKTQLIGGYDLQVLGVTLDSGKKVLFSKERTADQNGCSKTSS